LVAGSIRVEYDVKNNSQSPMYFALGSHEAYLCPEGVEDYDVIFERKETLKSVQVEKGIMSRKTETVLFESDTLPLYNKYFEIDALVLTDLKSRFVTLRNRKNGKSVSVSFPDCNYLLIWTIPEAPYVCLEPWTAPPSYLDEDYDIAESVRRLREGKVIQKHDLLLIKHEALEYDLMNKEGLSYTEAHAIANKSFNYQTALEEWLDENEG
jgi:galactose mutarotase-like enzyme